MPSGRGLTVCWRASRMWLVARLVGSPGLEVVGFGLARCPLLAGDDRPTGTAADRDPPSALGDPRRARDPRDGAARRREPIARPPRVPVARGSPAGGARAARPPGRHRHPAADRAGGTYTLVPHARGRYRIGPLAVDATDAFGLARRRLEFEGREDLIVTPEIEDLAGPPGCGFGANVGAVARPATCSARARTTTRCAGTSEGDDLRRIHWPSRGAHRRADDPPGRGVASRQRYGVRRQPRGMALGRRTARLRAGGLGRGDAWGSCSRSGGFALRLATRRHAAARPLRRSGSSTRCRASRTPRSRSVGPALARLRRRLSPETTLVFVAAPPRPRSSRPSSGAAPAFGPRLAVLVYPVDPDTRRPAAAHSWRAAPRRRA